MKEKYNYWKPSKIITNDYSVKTIKYEPEGISVILTSSNTEEDSIQLNFGAAIDLYRVCDEGVRQNLICNLYELLGDDALQHGRRFIVKNSKLISWLVEESGYLESSDLKHFILMNDDSVFDIVTRCNPIIKVIKKI